MVDYNTIFEKLKSDWMLTEIGHSVSKTASEAFWKLGLKYFTKLKSAPGNKKTPMFKSIRNNIYKDMVPRIDLQIGFKDRTTGEVTVVNDTVTPMKRFSPSKYEKLFEIATIPVSAV